jgi:hypothetical protein
VKDEISNEEVVVKEEPKPKDEKKVEVRELSPTTQVLCMNNTVGGLSYRPQFGGRGFRTEGYGKHLRIQLQDLENLYNEAPRIIDEGWLYILDHDVVEHMYLNNIYENLVSPKDVDKFINLPEEDIKAKLENAPHSMKATMFNVLKKKIQDGDQKLNYLPTRRFFEEILGAQFDV